MQNFASEVVIRPQTLQIFPASGSSEVAVLSESSGSLVPAGSSGTDFDFSGLTVPPLGFVSARVVSVISKRLTGPLRIADSFLRMYRAALIA